MINSLTFSKIALSSALLVATLAAGPTLSNASDNYARNIAKYESAQTLPAYPSVVLSQTFNISPVEIAKKYAPTTVEDWKRTLAKYEKITKITTTRGFSAVLEATPIDLSDNVTLTAATVQLSTVITTGLIPTKFHAGNEDAPVGIAFSKVLSADNAVDVINITDMAFYKAQIELSDAVKSKDSTAIIQALDKLLVQYKQQITELES